MTDPFDGTGFPDEDKRDTEDAPEEAKDEDE